MSKYAENHEKMLLNKLQQYIDKEEYKYESPYITKADVEVIIPALEKQIPKKPVLLDRPFAGVKVPVCPTCSIPEYYIPLYSRVRYCHDCGQKLDWSDGE